MKCRLVIHSVASGRRTRNEIAGLMDEHGVWQTDPILLTGIISDYFSHIFTLSQPFQSDITSILDTVQHTLPASLSISLGRPFVSADVKDVLFGMSPTKAPDFGCSGGG
ncbi:hypothetical protein ACOSP7_020906 [Xanthoceras sorbifolium]